MTHRPAPYRIAIGATVDPVPPLISSGCITKAKRDPLLVGADEEM